MFYSAELLSIRRNAKFAKCWLAANLSTKVFHSKFRRQTISAIGISETCEELLTYVKSQNSQRRLSLYLSSQLMFGVTRILSYQTDALLNLNWELWIRENAGNRIRDAEDGVGKKKRKKIQDLPADQTLLMPKKVPAVRTMRTNMVDEESITIPEIDEDMFCKYQAMMQDPGDFGALTEEQIDQMLQPGGLCFGESELTQVRVFPEILEDETPRVLQSTAQGMELETLENVAVGIEGMSLVRSTDESDVSSYGRLKQLPREEILKTPSKRRLSSPPKSETPSTKKQALYDQNGFAEPVAEPVAIDQPSEIQRPIDQPSETISEQLSSIRMSLDTLEIDNYVLRPTKGKARKLMIDKKTTLPDAELPHEPKKTSRPVLSKISAATLLTTPSSWLAWGKTLLADFKKIVSQPIDSAQILPYDDRDFRIHRRSRLREGGLPHDLVRSPELPIYEQPEDISSGIKQTTATSTEVGHSRTLEQISMTEEKLHMVLPSVADRSDDVAGQSGTVGMLPDLQESIPVDSDVPRIDPSIRASTTVVKSDLLGRLEILWQVKKIVHFGNLCPPGPCNRKEACRVFLLLLELHKDKEVKLTQAAPYENIYVLKYSPYF